MKPQEQGAGARLVLRGIAKRFGRVDILRDVDLDLAPGERHWIAGVNGAGKSTLLDIVGGGQRADAGTVSVDGTRVDGLSVHSRADLGIARSWQLPSVFGDLSVQEQLRTAVRLRDGRRYGLEVAHPGRVPDADDERAASLAADFGLSASLAACPPELSHAERRLLDLALAFAGPARLVLLDEPSSGLSHRDASALFARLARITRGVTVLIVEHDHRLATGFADRVSRLDAGRIAETRACVRAEGSDEDAGRA